MPRVRRQPAAAGHRLDRPLPDTTSRTRRRRSRRRCGRSRTSCARARCGISAARTISGWQVVEAQLVRAVRAPSPLRPRAERVQPAGPPDREGAGAGVPEVRAGRPAVLPAGERLPVSGKYRQGEEPPEGTRIAGLGARGARRCCRTATSTSWRASSGSPSERGKTVLDAGDRRGWLSHDFVPSVIAGATKPEQVEQNVEAAEWRLTPEEMVGDRRDGAERGGTDEVRLKPDPRVMVVAPPCGVRYHRGCYLGRRECARRKETTSWRSKSNPATSPSTPLRRSSSTSSTA